MHDYYSSNPQQIILILLKADSNIFKIDYIFDQRYNAPTKISRIFSHEVNKWI
jgi:hypothetical protein